MRFKALLSLLALLTLNACGAPARATPSPLPTVVLDGNGATTPASPKGIGAGVTASGVVAPAQEAQIAFAMGGMVESVYVAVGDQVEAGQVLARLAGDEQLQAALSAAELDVLTAQQDLDRLQERAGLEAAQAQVDLADAQEAVEDAQRTLRYQQKGYRAGSVTIKAAEAELALAESAMKDAKGAYDQLSGKPANNPARAQAYKVYAAAYQRYQSALASLNWYTGHPTEVQQAQLDAEVALAEAQEGIARLAWERVKDGPDPDQVALLRARLKSARDRADAARAGLADLELKAPFNGTVSEVTIHSGEWVVPGQSILVLADLNQLRIETTDLSELDVPEIELGQPVTAVIEALNQEVTGHVSLVSPLADTLGGDVVYDTIIELDSWPPGLRAGMSAEVHFGAGPSAE